MRERVLRLAHQGRISTSESTRVSVVVQLPLTLPSAKRNMRRIRRVVYDINAESERNGCPLTRRRADMKRVITVATLALGLTWSAAAASHT